MKRYAVVPINFKYDDDKGLIYRCVLIRFRGYKDDRSLRVYKHTKIVTVSDYFLNPYKSHVYKFFDKGYKTVKAISPEYLEIGFDQVMNLIIKNAIIRKYHTNKDRFILEFKCRNNQEAIFYFNKQFKGDFILDER